MNEGIYPVGIGIVILIGKSCHRKTKKAKQKSLKKQNKIPMKAKVVSQLIVYSPYNSFVNVSVFYTHDYKQKTYTFPVGT